MNFCALQDAMISEMQIYIFKGVDFVNGDRTASARKNYIKQQEKSMGKKFTRTEFDARFALYTVEDTRDSWRKKLNNAESDVRNSQKKITDLENALDEAVINNDELEQNRIARELGYAEQELNSDKNNVHLITNPYSLLSRYAIEVASAYKRGDFDFICKNVPIKKIDNMGSIAGKLDDILLKQVTDLIENVLKSIDEHNNRGKQIDTAIKTGATAIGMSQPNKEEERRKQEAMERVRRRKEAEQNKADIASPIVEPVQTESSKKNIT